MPNFALGMIRLPRVFEQQHIAFLVKDAAKYKYRHVIDSPGFCQGQRDNVTSVGR